MTKSETAEDTQRADDAVDPAEHPWLAARRGQQRWIPPIASLLCLLIGLSDVLAIFSPGFHARLHRINTYVPGTLTNAARSTDVIVGLLLMMLSHGLRRRKRRAWQAVLGLLVLDITIHIVHFRTMHVPTTVVAVILLGTLLYFRRDFYAVGDWRTRWLAFWVFIGLGLADLAIGLGYLSVSGLAGSYSLPTRLLDVTSEVAGVTGNIVFLSDARADTYHAMTTALGVFTLVVTAYLFLRPAEPKARLSRPDIEGIRQLLARHGERDSLAYFALRDDKSVIWSPTGKACIGYRVVSGVMLAGGDPLGDPEAWPGAIQAFLDQAARHAWAPAVMGCSELGAEVWCREGDLTALELGDEGVVNVADFSLSGRPMRNVRQMCSRVARAGYTAEVRRVGDVPRAEIDNILQVADSWRGSQTERGFSMALGRVGAPGDEQCVIATATCDGTLRAVLHFVPWGSDGLSLDLMRRDRDAQPGLNDFLIVEAIKAAPDLGVKRISLNFAVFRAALERGEKIGAGPVLRAWRSILLFLSKWFQIESLYKFNAKFNPVWQPRFFVFPTAKDAPRIALAALEAEAFLVWPTLEPRRLARQLGLGRLRRRLWRARRRRAR
jgi:lysyl-tRNA synthetase class 2